MPRNKKVPVPTSVNAYAKRRGVSAPAVRKAIASGRLSASVVMVDARRKGRLIRQPKIADVDLADQEWEAETRPGQGGDGDASDPAPDPTADGNSITYKEARRRREIELWRQAEIKREADALELALKKKEVLTVDDIESRLLDVITSARTKLLGVPSRARQQDPGLTADQIRLVDDLIREALDDLAEWNGQDV